ncbi:Hypothetical predicted protein, partial [Marmota monax]
VAGSDRRTRPDDRTGDAGRPGSSARPPQPRLRDCGARPHTSQSRLLRREAARALYTLLKIACEAPFQSERAEFELSQWRGLCWRGSVTPGGAAVCHHPRLVRADIICAQPPGRERRDWVARGAGAELVTWGEEEWGEPGGGGGGWLAAEL